MGSQIFDYWYAQDPEQSPPTRAQNVADTVPPHRFDGSGNIVEHYSDGDLVNEDHQAGREPAAADTLHVWGPNIPLAFLSGKMEDLGKALPAPPDALESTPAQVAAVA